MMTCQLNVDEEIYKVICMYIYLLSSLDSLELQRGT